MLFNELSILVNRSTPVSRLTDKKSIAFSMLLLMLSRISVNAFSVFSTIAFSSSITWFFACSISLSSVESSVFKDDTLSVPISNSEFKGCNSLTKSAIDASPDVITFSNEPYLDISPSRLRLWSLQNFENFVFKSPRLIPILSQKLVILSFAPL